MRRIITLVVVASVMAAMMLAMAMPAFAARGEQGGAAANCGPPGQSHSEFAKDPGSAVEAWGGLPASLSLSGARQATRKTSHQSK
jgi:hypothetical protein